MKRKYVAGPMSGPIMEDGRACTGRAFERAAYAIFIFAFTVYTLRRLLWLHAEHPSYHGFALDLIGLIGASTILAGVGFARPGLRLRSVQSACVGGLLGVIFFISTLGFGLVDPSNIDWLMRGDWAQHFIGWYFYRSAPWTWPLGAFDTYWYPEGTSVLYTDSLPLLAVPLKLAAPWLPSRFQYIGFWLLVNCVLHGVFSALLMRCFTRNIALQAMGTGLLLLTPVFIGRIAHDTLTTQWLILACFWLYFRKSEPDRFLSSWLIVAALAALVHPYLSAMVLTLALAFYSLAYARHWLNWQAIASHIATIVATTLLCWWVTGAFIFKVRSGFRPDVYSANLLTWVDSQSHSRWLPALPLAGDGQHEGMGYLGVGVLFLCVVAVGLALSRRQQSSISAVSLAPLLVAVGALTLFAFSTRVTLGSTNLVDFTPKHLFAIGAFRCSGRFIWPSVYLITLLAIASVARRGGRFAIRLLGVAFLAQLLDLTPMHIQDARIRTGIFAQEAEPVLHDTYWAEAVRGHHHITLVPPAACGVEAAPYFPFSLLAADNRMTINTGYLARYDGMRWSKYCDELRAEIDRGLRDADTLYVMRPDEGDRFQQTSLLALDCRRIEGYFACTAK